MRNRRKDILQLALSLLLAAGIWFIHILSQSYYVHIPFRIKVTSNIEGYAPESVAMQDLFLGGKTSGFFILGYNLSDKKPVETTIDILPSKFTSGGMDSDIFVLNSSSISDKISESVNSIMEVTFIPDAMLEFRFERRSFKRVPVSSELSVECAPQYMRTSDIRFTPDSVTLYGNDEELVSVNEIKTVRKTISGADRNVNGVVSLVKMSKLRINPPEVAYSVDVARYVEHTFTASLSSVNVPSGKMLFTLPAQVEVTCRLPFGAEISTFENDAIFTVDYNDVVSSRSGKVAPRMDDTGVSAYSCSFNPPFVECVISDIVR